MHNYFARDNIVSTKLPVIRSSLLFGVSKCVEKLKAVRFIVCFCRLVQIDRFSNNAKVLPITSSKFECAVSL